MGVNFASFGLNYIDDSGDTITGLKFRFKPPPGADVAQIVAALGSGATLDPPNVPCPVSAGMKPRKLVFINSAGGSTSLVMPEREKMVDVANVVKPLLETAPDGDGQGGISIVCIKLIGEEFDDLIDSLADSGKGPPEPGENTANQTGGKQFVYSGNIEYGSDGNWGQRKFLSVKVHTDVEGSPPSVVSGQWNDCVGAFTDLVCPGNEPRVHRRYIATTYYQIDDPNDPNIPLERVPQTTEVPVKDFQPGSVKQCGQNLANNSKVACLEYRGESNPRFHLLVNNP